MPAKAAPRRSSVRAAAPAKRTPAVTSRNNAILIVELPKAQLKEVDGHVHRLREEYFSSTVTEYERKRAAALTNTHGVKRAENFLADCRRKRTAQHLPGAPSRMPSRAQLVRHLLALGLDEFRKRESGRAGGDAVDVTIVSSPPTAALVASALRDTEKRRAIDRSTTDK